MPAAVAAPAVKPRQDATAPLDKTTGRYFASSALGGFLACCVTHTLMTPIDLVKCNSQTNPSAFPSVRAGMSSIYSGRVASLGFAPGVRGLTTGWAPTFVGYGIQGACKFGLNEYFKYLYGRTGVFAATEQGVPSIPLSVAASASAELVADVGLCPMEAVKVRVQTSPDFARGLADGLPKMLRTEGLGSLYAGLVPLWGRQVPYTVTKFLAFERIADAIYARLPKAKQDMSGAEQMLVVFSSGYLAGILCGVISHPADTMVSAINKVATQGSVLHKVQVIYSGEPAQGIKGIGWGGLWKGLGPRVFMIGTLTSLQFFGYGAVLAALGYGTPGGH